jgi:hypothetical protein
MEEDGRADVDDFDLGVGIGFNENVFGFEIAVHNVESVECVESQKDLFGDGLNSRQGKVLGTSAIGVVEIVLEEFCEDHEMFAMVEVVVHGHEAAFVGVAVSLYQFQQFDLIEGLVQVVLAVQDYLQAESLLLVGGTQVAHLDGFGELGLPEHRHYLEASSQHVIDDDRQFALLFKASLLAVVYHFEVLNIVDNPVRLQRVHFIALPIYLTQGILLPKMILGGRRVGSLSCALELLVYLVCCHAV